MGQKFSDIRGYMLVMDHHHQQNRHHPERLEGKNTPSSSSATSSSSTSEQNGNERFEIIYGNRNEPDASVDLINGNVITDADSDYENSVLEKVEELLRIKKKRQKEVDGEGSKKRNNWTLNLNCARMKSNPEANIPDSANVCDSCICTGYRRTDENAPGAAGMDTLPQNPPVNNPSSSSPIIDLSKFNPDDFPIEDCDERARLERAREMAEGVEPPPGYTPGVSTGQSSALLPSATPDSLELSLDNLTALFQARLGLGHGLMFPDNMLAAVIPMNRIAHTQVDYVHCLVPDLLHITSLPFYWGKMDRYEAERLLEGRPEGTFLLRDSAQEEYLFSVSFRKYERSLHARIEQWNHRFSFDSHDPGVFASETVCGLIEHYKDSPFCMFFEPMLTLPLNRNFTFPLQHLCRAAVCNNITYDNINALHLPKVLKSYLKEYHYKQRVRVRWLDPDI